MLVFVKSLRGKLLLTMEVKSLTPATILQIKKELLKKHSGIMTTGFVVERYLSNGKIKTKRIY